MKKILIVFVLVFSILSLQSCSVLGNNSDEPAYSPNLPSGRAREIRVQQDDYIIDLGPGEFEYVNETTLKVVRDSDGQMYYVSVANLIFITVER